MLQSWTSPDQSTPSPTFPQSGGPLLDDLGPAQAGHVSLPPPLSLFFW